MPLSSFQSRVLRVLAANRNPESYVAGAAPLALGGARTSHDIDLFHDRELAMQIAVAADAAALAAVGLAITWTRRFPTLHSAIVQGDGDSTLLEWLVDSAYRFFPVMPDDVFGYVLHPADIATNKALAAVGRREARDVVDLLDIHNRYLPLGAVVWAASGKDPGLSPEGIIAEIRRNARYLQADYDRLLMDFPVDSAAIARALRVALEEADAFVRAMPAGQEGMLFLRDGKAVQPEPANLGGYVAHAGRERGHWPSSGDIGREMFRPT